MHDCADCVFNSLQGAESNTAVRVEASRAFFQSCVFRDLMEANREEIINPKQWKVIAGTFGVFEANSTLVLSNCTLAELYGTAEIVVSTDAKVYSDNALHEVRLHRKLSAIELLACSVSSSNSLATSGTLHKLSTMHYCPWYRVCWIIKSCLFPVFNRLHRLIGHWTFLHR